MENLEFLSDVVPKTTTYRTFKQKQNAGITGAQQLQPQQSNGQSKLDTHMTTSAVGEQQATNGASPVVEMPALAEDMDVDVADAEDVEFIDDDDDVEDGTEGSMHTANDEPEPLEGGRGGGDGDGGVRMEDHA